MGNYRNGGKEWTPQGEATEVEAYDFIDKDLGKAIPYGIYDPSYKLGWVSVGTDHDTAQFAVRSIGHWWEKMGEWLYPEAKEILIMCDGGGSNATRSRLWKKSLQEWADREEMSIMVCHFPPGTSKWNKIEHRMFCHITRNWRGKPLVSHEVIIKLIGVTTTEKGLRIHAQLDEEAYPLGIKVSDEEMNQLSLERADFHGEWNYLIRPRVFFSLFCGEFLAFRIIGCLRAVKIAPSFSCVRKIHRTNRGSIREFFWCVSLCRRATCGR